MQRVPAAGFSGAVLLQLHTVRMLDTVLARGVIARAALRASHRNYNACLFLCHRFLPIVREQHLEAPFQLSFT